MSRFYCTSCSKEKTEAAGSIPAVDRYDSERIRTVHQQAKNNCLGLLLLSGKYGLIGAHEPIPNYDHQLTQDEIKSMTSKVQSQLITLGVKHLTFFGVDELVDPSWHPYWEVIRRSSKGAQVELTTFII